LTECYAVEATQFLNPLFHPVSASISLSFLEQCHTTPSSLPVWLFWKLNHSFFGAEEMKIWNPNPINP
jgi:hypothetical protein